MVNRIEFNSGVELHSRVEINSLSPCMPTEEVKIFNIVLAES
jgi:hypothetical protein